MSTDIWSKTWTVQDAPEEIIRLALTNDGLMAPRTTLAVRQVTGGEALAIVLYKKWYPDEVATPTTGEYRVMWVYPPPSGSPFVPAWFPMGDGWTPREGCVPVKPDPEFAFWGLKIWGDYRIVLDAFNLDLGDVPIIRGSLRKDISGFSIFS
jgi:hypothetical protein